MKRILPVIVLLTSFAFASCEKEALPSPSTNPTNATPVQVEYRVFGESGHLTIEYLVPEAGQMVTQEVNADRTNNSMIFEWKAGSLFSVKARNAMPSGKEVKAEIYINGNLVKSATANAPGSVASAEIVY